MGSVCGWSERLKADAKAKQYLFDRGIDPLTIKEHLIGWNGRSYTLPVFDERGPCSEPSYLRPDGRPEDTRAVWARESIVSLGRNLGPRC